MTIRHVQPGDAFDSVSQSPINKIIDVVNGLAPGDRPSNVERSYNRVIVGKIVDELKNIAGGVQLQGYYTWQEVLPADNDYAVTPTWENGELKGDNECTKYCAPLNPKERAVKDDIVLILVTETIYGPRYWFVSPNKIYYFKVAAAPSAMGDYWYVTANPCTDKTGATTDTDTDFAIYLPKEGNCPTWCWTTQIIGAILDMNWVWVACEGTTHGVFQVDVKKDGGTLNADGTTSGGTDDDGVTYTTCDITYKVVVCGTGGTAGEIAINTGMTPDLGRSENIRYHIPAVSTWKKGTGYIDESGVFYLREAGEYPKGTTC